MKCLIFSLFLIFTNCNDIGIFREYKQSIHFTEIAKEDGGSPISNSKFVIKNKTDWNKLKTQLGNFHTDKFKEKDIDFNKYMVIAVFDETRPYIGYSIHIAQIFSTRNRLVITVHNENKGGLGAMQTIPFHIVKVPLIEKPVVFNHKKIGYW